MTSDEAMHALTVTGYSWRHQFYPVLEADPEAPDFVPKDHHYVDLILSYEDLAEGWGATFAEAAADALRQLQ